MIPDPPQLGHQGHVFGSNDETRSRGSSDEDAPLPQQRQRQETGFSARTDETARTGYTNISSDYPACRSPPDLGIDRRSEIMSPQQPFSQGQISRDLSSIQIFLIALSGTIGLGLFTDSGEILRIAGPGGALLAFGLIGLVVVFVMSGVAEMIGHWPISGALVEFIKTFVDRELGLILGVAYWFAYAVTFGTLISALLDLGKHWAWSSTLRLLVLGLGVPVIAIFINLQNVKVFGIIESVLGCFKLILVLGAFITMCVINAGGASSSAIGLKYMSDGLKADHRITTSPVVAFLVAIPIATYGFAGVEIIAVAALEAKKPKSLKWPPKYVAVIIAMVYFLSVFGFCLNVYWQDPSLPSMSSRATGGTTTGASILIIAAAESGIPSLAGFLNICLIVTVFSAANTTLYVASRTLFGLCRDVNPRGWAWRRSVCAIGRTHPNSRVPMRAVLLSLVPGVWFPWVHIGDNDQSFQEIMSGVATVSIVLVWAAQCLAFLRYRCWLSKHEGHLVGWFENYSIERMPNPDLLTHIQPVPAVFGLLGCLITVLGFSTASWWQWGHPSASSVLAAFLMPGLLSLFWIILKLASPDGNKGIFNSSVKLSPDWKVLKKVIIKLQDMIREDNPPNQQDLPEASRA